jgi:hypothetical protein
VIRDITGVALEGTGSRRVVAEKERVTDRDLASGMM